MVEEVEMVEVVVHQVVLACRCQSSWVVVVVVVARVQEPEAELVKPWSLQFA